ncbi:MAG: hypothetical protein A3H42_01355 [Deltaproteobacteria bacterium RIFCSPLOWO2_02_FULL_46_8]|nr:MAG: hypothetical protein A3H42_01355 [Deltaproteobacteria bacterium RIFCSPLOWO2_02_FULL_46_8]
MVDKIDKPDAPSPYAVGGTTEAKKDKPRDQQNQEDLPTFKRQNPNLYREKFQGELGVSKTVKVPLDQIDKILFRRATPYHGVPTAEANLVWKDGRTTEGVSFRIKNWQDFLKIKNLKQGEMIPPPFWNFGGEELEIIIVKMGTTSGSWDVREIQKQDHGPWTIDHGPKGKKKWRDYGPLLKLFDPSTGRIRPGIAGLYFLGLVTIILLSLLIFK